VAEAKEVSDRTNGARISSGTVHDGGTRWKELLSP
jgi:hypothetical protein